ncbi:P-loop NTPase fold protein [Rhizobium ruizarguesonis]
MLMSQVDPVLTRDADRQSEDYVRRVKALLDTTGPDLLKDDERARLAQLIATSDPRQTKGFDRIILYIDDLDRCPPEQVVNVLQAVQLLLSFPLFVVVVAVDSRWVIRSLEDHYAKLLEAEGRDGDAATASDYLEKIFQIPYWVRPMTPISSVALLSSMTTGAISPGSLTEAPMTPVVHDGDPQPNAPEPERAVAVSPVGSTHAAVQRNADTVDNGLPDVPGDTTNLVSGARALVLTEHERAYMLNIAPWVGSTPRRALRFLNIYRIIKASLDPANLQRLESGGYRALLTEIALVVGSRRNEGLGIVQALAKGSSIDSLRHGSTDLVLSAMAKGVLNAFADSPEPADLDNLAFYWEMASRYIFGNERPLRTIPQAPATNGEAVQNSGRQE